MKISLIEFFIGRLCLQSFSIGRCLHSSHSGYMGVGIWHRWSTGEKLAPRRYHLLSIICDSLAIFAPTRIFTSIHITYCVIDRSLEVGFTAGFSKLEWGMEQISKTQNIWRNPLYYLEIIKSFGKFLFFAKNKIIPKLFLTVQTTSSCVLDILPCQIVLRVVCSKK